MYSLLFGLYEVLNKKKKSIQITHFLLSECFCVSMTTNHTVQRRVNDTFPMLCRERSSCDGPVCPKPPPPFSSLNTRSHLLLPETLLAACTSGAQPDLTAARLLFNIRGSWKTCSTSRRSNTNVQSPLMFEQIQTQRVFVAGDLFLPYIFFFINPLF